MQLRDSLQRLARRARSSTWPEYSELDCFACHHSLTAAKDSWRQEVGYAGRTPGVPAWNAARYVVFRYPLEETEPHSASKLMRSFQLAGLMNQLNGNREQIAASADPCFRPWADQIVKQVDAQPGDLIRAMTFNV